MSIVERLQEFLENEARSCSMDFGCVTPLYVYRMWGTTVAIKEIKNALAYLKAKYNKVVFFINTNHRYISDYNLKERNFNHINYTLKWMNQ